MTYEKGNVLRDKTDGRKYVVGRKLTQLAEAEPERYELVCETPHADGDFSYFCWNEYCRCRQ